MSPLIITLKPTYEIPLSGVIAATAQGGVASARLRKPFRIHDIIINFGDDHADAVLHYFLTSTNKNISTTNISIGDNVVPAESPTPYYIGHAVLRRVKIIKEFKAGRRFLKVHVVNNNAYAITFNVSFIIEEI